MIEFVFEIVFEIFGEFILAFVWEALSAAFGHGVKPRKPVESPLLAVIGYLVFGTLAGAASLWFMPELFVRHELSRYANLVVTPLAIGLAMGRIGAWRRSHEKQVIRLESFAYAFFFALGMAGVRFVWGR